ncbi:aromatic ring-hydroxylating dioxygenase subunit alpha [Frankia sp. CNm7]|uniref:Aromatic ring-hydroxylating dioxygenase subunit alpha n=1 Tax=Frankia nepalensis TaxID=1836974 RepID=A0A937UNV6_9ACTN|nr:aromatic ring-hydroxylating dioxygenase subunit alpha [Frankia nepalensis]MBL7496800.1 aromatic ring-hydroxylating dioxygenase subunit alpha [Frankia nepalensis]MBL7513945.1 aromatic ring-hydroxylating dioxygenase subunit alpha [Frankia nepalensis]MBL7523723.1 aromatic ring-hydroxylating dioxygenase subunit alpha [Frankia nepalensis]MBL7626640.1 aromatic ring-hydroxylating dioxygenase subunit alpha [Frankia nepalensis]
MDREALEHGIARRLLDHIEHRTTDMADDVLELPVDVYSAERQAEETEALFLDQPLVLCLSGALPGPETYRTVDILGTPVLLTRDGDGQVHAMFNACRHRGVRLVDGAGEAIRLTCPFHAWTYGLDGKLGRMPVPEGFAGMRKEDKGLVRLEVAEGYGLIVGRLRPGPPIDIDEYLGPELAGELSLLDFASWEPHGEPHTHRVAANWKVTLDTFRENYHFNYLHKTTLASYAFGGVLTFDAFGRHLRNASALRSIVELKERPEGEWADVNQHFSYQYALFPNVSLTFDARHVELWQILPVDESTSEVVHTVYLRPGLSDEERSKAVDMAPWICETVVDGEDFWVAGRTEPGVRLGLLDTVVFGRNEPAPQHLHRGFEDVLAEYRARRAAEASA